MHAANQTRHNHNHNQETFRRAITAPDGTMRRITRIELEPLDATHCRWTIWGEEGRLFTAEAKPDDMGALMMSTRILIDCQMSGPPAARGPRPFPAK